MAKLALVLLALAILGPASTPIAAGRWELSNQMEEMLFNGRSDGALAPRSRPQLVCLSQTDAAYGPGLAFSDKGLCQVLNSRAKDGVFSFETECKATESGDTIVTKADGGYTADSYVGKSTSIQRRSGMLIEMRTKMRAKRVGDC